MASRFSATAFGLILTTFVAGVFVWAGLTKLNAPTPFAKVISFLLSPALTNGVAVTWIAVAVAALEVVVGSSLLIWWRKRPPQVLALLLLVSFSIVLVILGLSHDAPGCGCFGLVLRKFNSREVAFGLIRNAALVIIVVWLLCMDRPPISTKLGGIRGASSTIRGFTLVEVLVAMVVVAVVISLTIPVLRVSRQTARDAARVAMAAQLTIATHAYCLDSKEVFPYFATVGQPLGRIICRDVELPPVYFRSQRWFWTSVLVPEYLDVHRKAIEPEGRAEYLRDALGYPSSIIASSYEVTSTIFAAPLFWRRTIDNDWNRDEYFRATRVSEVVYPSLKGLLVGDLSGPGGPAGGNVVPVGCCDGSARSVLSRTLNHGRAVARPYGSTSAIIESTEDGLAGRDF